MRPPPDITQIDKRGDEAAALLSASFPFNGPPGLKPAYAPPVVAVPPQGSPSPAWQPTSESGFRAGPEALPGERDGMSSDRLADLFSTVPQRGTVATGADGAVPQGEDEPTSGPADAGRPAPADEESLPTGQAALEAMAAPPPPAPTTPGPSLPIIPPRLRTTGPSRPARLPGSLAFGSGATAGASIAGDCSWVTYGEASVTENTVSLGVAGRLQNANQPADVHGASMLLPPAVRYSIAFDVNLSTWDAYNEYQGENTGTGYWDSFSVSVTSEPYPYTAWMDPVSLPFTWGGNVAGDGIQDNRIGRFTIDVDGNPIGPNYLNVVLDTFSQPDGDARYPSWGDVTIILGAPQVESVTFVPAGGTRGGVLDLNGNPNGEPGKPAFGGGDRFFPDASPGTRTQGRNRAKIRAVVAGAGAGVAVYFRSFDVDDPSANATIDPNGNNGRDNRGFLTGAELDQPGTLPAGQEGYRGRLRPASGGAFAVEGAVVTVNTDANGIAEAELVTSYNPGDNFRVVASCNQQEVQNLNDTTSVPTTGPIANFAGRVTNQLSVWRRLHIEQDRMAAIPWQGPLAGVITDVAAGGGPHERIVTTNLNIAQANQFVGGSSRTRFVVAGLPRAARHPILSHTTGAGARVTIGVSDDPIPSVGDPITLTQGDYQAGNTTAIGAPVNGKVEITTDQWFARADEYVGGILRIGGVNYHVTANTSNDTRRPIDVVTILANAAPAGGAFTIYQDDFSTNSYTNSQKGEIVSHGTPGGGQVVVTTDMNIPVANLFAGGILRGGNANYTIVSNTAGSNATVTVMTEAMLPASITLYASLGNNAPTTIVDPNANDAELYAMLQPTTVRAQNRFADAYIEPELNALNPDDSNDVTPTSHSTARQDILQALANPFRGTTPGGVPRPNDYETEFFWSVYVLAGFEPHFAADGDPDDEQLTISGFTDGGPGQPKQISMVYLEALRDRFFNANADRVGAGVTLSLLRTRVAVHEIGHQLLIAHGLPPDVVDEHRNNPPNLMHMDAGAVADAAFYLHPADIVPLRQRIFSP